MIARGQNFKKFDLNIVGSSIFGRYPKISLEKTYNMFISDNWLVDYAGYQKVSFDTGSLGAIGRGIHTSTKFNKLVVVVDNKVYLVDIFFDQNILMTFDTSAILIGTLETTTGVVYITENDIPQIVISDGRQIYYYDPELSPTLLIATSDGVDAPISFTPGYIDFHDTYVLAAASNDTYVTNAPNSTWRLGVSAQVAFGTAYPPGRRLVFPNNPSGIGYIGLLQTKPDNTQAVIRMPSKGNMILVMGSTVTEAWFDVGAQNFPYQRDNHMSIDYGCLNPATIASMDEIVVWLAQNEKSGPIVMYTRGGMPEKITTDGIDYLFSQLINPSDSQGFLYRQDGHLIYHLNFYTDNLSLFYDFNTKKFFHASDEFENYFIAAQVAFFKNQYYFVTRNNGSVYAFDTIFTTYDGQPIPRIRVCASIRDPDQEYRICNDIGFTIEQGEDNFNSNFIENLTITNGGSGYTTATLTFIGGNGFNAAATATITSGSITAVTITNPGTGYTYPPSIQVTGDGTGAMITSTLSGSSARVDLSVSRDGGINFGSIVSQYLNPEAVRPNKLMWWNIGIANDLIPQFRFVGLGRFVAWDGEAWLRQ